MQLQRGEGATRARAEADIGQEAVLESMAGMMVVWTRTTPKVTMLPGWDHFLSLWRQGPSQHSSQASDTPTQKSRLVDSTDR